MADWHESRASNVHKHRVGDIVTVTIRGCPQHAWITGLDLNAYGEVLFLVRYADNPSEEKAIHPGYVDKLI
jgi:hypothetical protein